MGYGDGRHVRDSFGTMNTRILAWCMLYRWDRRSACLIALMSGSIIRSLTLYFSK
jgi:hypothetical protein